VVRINIPEQPDHDSPLIVRSGWLPSGDNMLLSINTKIVNKPADKSQHGTPFNPVDLTVDELIDQIMKGHAYSAQYRENKRKSENFIATGILAVDIDHGMTLAEAIKSPYLNFFASFIHTTATHTDEHNRFRIVFELAEPITDAVVYRKAITGLIDKFGGDRQTKDAARFFYGNSDAVLHRFNMRLPPEEVSALVVVARQTQSYEDGLAAKHNPMIRTKAPFDATYLVTRSDGISLPIGDVTPDNRSIHCPFHPDRHPSAFVVYSRTGSVGVHCHACGSTSWVGGGSTKPEAEWHEHYQKAVEMQQWLWSIDEATSMPAPSRAVAGDGTEVWLSNSRYLPPVDIKPGITYIRSPKGSGKTEQLANIVKQLKAQGQKILLVGHRRLLLNNLAKRLGIEYYLERGKGDGGDASGCLAVSLESLPLYVRPAEDKFDVIMIDESEQVVSHFTSKTLSKMRMASRSMLEHLMKQAAYVVCSDADIGPLTSGLVFLMLEKGNPDHLILNRYRRGDAGADDGATNDIFVYSNEGALLDLLQQDVLDNKRCFVATNSKKKAGLINDMLELQNPELKILLVTSATSELSHVKRFTTQPSIESLKYDVVICSPSLSTGVDITFADEKPIFDGVYGFFIEDITTHFEIDQQLSRVRNPGKVAVWVSPRSYPWETDPQVIRAELERNRDMAEQIVGYSDEGHPRYADDAVLDLFAWILSTRRASLMNLKALLVALRSSNGWNVRTVEAPSATRLYGEARDQQLVELIVAAKDLSEMEYGMLKARYKSMKGLDAERDAMIRRYDLRKAYNVKLVTADLVELDDNGSFRSTFKNLEILYTPEEGSSANPGVLTRDAKEVRSRDLASVDWANRTRKKRLLNDLLQATGLLSDDGVFSFDTPVSKRNLDAFVETVERSCSDLESLFGLKLRGDLRTKPVYQLKKVLGTIGLSLTTKTRSRKGATHTDNYFLDEKRWEHVVTTCGLDQGHISRQLERSQVAVA
jgi:hypothetical protein